MKTDKLADEIHKPVNQIFISRLLSHYARWLRGETHVDPKPTQNQNILVTTMKGSVLGVWYLNLFYVMVFSSASTCRALCTSPATSIAVVAHDQEAILPSHFWLPSGLVLVFISWPQPL